MTESRGIPCHPGRGNGASSLGDGNCVYIFLANGANTPVEIFESDTPLIVEKSGELLVDSAGPGRNKGGLGKRIVFRVPDDAYAPLPPVNLGMQAGSLSIPLKVSSAATWSKGPVLINGKPGNPYGLTQLKPETWCRSMLPGGGGYGNPLEREPESVEADC